MIKQGSPLPVAGLARGSAYADPLPENQLFSTLSAEEYMRMTVASRMYGFAEGEVLTRQGQDVTNVYFIRQGRARAELSSSFEEGPLAVVNFLGPGSDIGLISVVDGAPHSVTVRAMEEVWATGVPVGTLRRLLAAHPEWYIALAQVAIARLRTSGAWLEKLL